ncbi:MAG: hypothetical protein ACI4M3_06275 [Acutalibacteraceae bacterium]
MKILKLFFDFFTHNKLKLFFLLVIMISAMIMLSETIGQVRYYLYEISFYAKDELKDSIFVQACHTFRYTILDETGHPYEDYDSEEYREKYDALEEQIENEDFPQKSKTFSAVEDVYCYAETSGEYNKNYTTIQLASEKTYEIFDYQLSSGTWFKDCKQTSPYPNAVVCGNVFRDVPIGSDIEIINHHNNRKNSIKVHVIGKINPPYFTLDFSNRTVQNSIEGYGFRETARKTTCIFLLNNQFTQNYISDNQFTSDNLHNLSYLTDSFSSFFVKFKETATEEEIDEYLNYISQYSGDSKYDSAYADTNTVVEATRRYTKEIIINSLPLSLFYAVISTFTVVCVSSIIVRKKLLEHYTYYLCGCSRKKSFSLLASGLLYIGFIAFIITSLYLFFKKLIIIFLISYPETIIDQYSYLYIFLYVAVCLLLSLIIPFCTFRKYTPIELYRNKDGRI